MDLDKYHVSIKPPSMNSEASMLSPPQDHPRNFHPGIFRRWSKHIKQVEVEDTQQHQVPQSHQTYFPWCFLLHQNLPFKSLDHCPSLFLFGQPFPSPTLWKASANFPWAAQVCTWIKALWSRAAFRTVPGIEDALSELVFDKWGLAIHKNWFPVHACHIIPLLPKQ